MFERGDNSMQLLINTYNLINISCHNALPLPTLHPLMLLTEPDLRSCVDELSYMNIHFKKLNSLIIHLYSHNQIMW